MGKKYFFIGFIGMAVLGAVGLWASGANAAEPVQRRGAVSTSSGVSARPQSAAATQNVVPVRAASVSAAQSVTSRAAAMPGRARTAVPSVNNATLPLARAGALQKVVQTGTGINAPTTNTVVDATCRERYFGCMDSFCMLENDNGGRCLCSDRKSELDEILTQIETLDMQSYRLATEGVEKIDMGAKADYVFDVVSDIEKTTASESAADRRQQNRLNVDLGIWGQVDFDLDTNIFDQSGTDISSKSGESLRTAVNNICIQQMSGCEKDITMLQMMYSQNIASDCRAFENELNKRKNASAQKLSTAQSALRAAALESFETANKWDLGQCTIQMKKCVQNNGCGDDFTGCVNIAASANAAGARNTRMTRIKGPNTYIEIAASSLDALEAKKILCFDTVTSSCIAVRDKVWPAFLQEAAPAVKSAELLAESNIRMSCISNISECFQKACRDTMDPNNPEGSFDLCLSRPEAIEHLCKVQIDQCALTDAKDTIMDFVRARLAAMRVDACTSQAKACFTADTACGKNFENCIGLGLEDIKKMCPAEKLTACNVLQISEIDHLIQGIYLAIDNSALEQCQRYVDEKMIEICGDLSFCEAFAEDTGIGTESLTSFKDSRGDYVIEGLMNYGAVTIANNTLDVSSYMQNLASADTRIRTQINAALTSVSNKVANKISLMESDTRIEFCVKGRRMNQVTGENRRSGERFPNLLDNYKKTILDAAITRASVNYNKKYNELYAAAFKGQSAEISRAACMAMASNLNEPICAAWSTDNDGNPVCIQHEVSGTNLFNDSSTSGGMDTFATSITIPGLKISEIVKLNASGKSDFVQLGPAGEMIASIQTSAIFSESANSCTINMTNTGCKGAEAVYNTETTNTKKCSSGWTLLGGCGVGFWSMGGGKKTTVTTKTEFAGTICTEFLEPVTTQTVIQM